MNQNYELGLLYLLYSLTQVDGKRDVFEIDYFAQTFSSENFSMDLLDDFNQGIEGCTNEEIHDKGLALLKTCTYAEKTKAFAYLYGMTEVDGKVHLREIDLLLKDIQQAGVRLSDIIHYRNS